MVELACSLPMQWRVHYRTGKFILKKAFADVIPPAIARRKKMGFGVPVGRWFRNELRAFFIDSVLSEHALQRGWFNKASLEQLLCENDSRQFDHGHKLWSLLMLELWCRNYIDQKTRIS